MILIFVQPGEKQIRKLKQWTHDKRIKIFKTVFVHTLTYGHESSVMTETVRAQASKMSFFTKNRWSYTI